MKLRERANYIMLVMVFICMVYMVVSLTSKDQLFDGMEDLSTSWDYNGKKCELPVTGERKEGSKIVVSRVLPDNGIESGILLFKTENIYWSVSVDGKLIDSYTKHDKKYFNSRTAGDRWNLVYIPDGYDGKELTITMEATDSLTANFIKRVYFASLDEAVSWINKWSVSVKIVAVAIMVFGFFYLALSEMVIYKWKEKRVLTFVGLFAVFVSIWLGLQNPVGGSFMFFDGYFPIALSYLSLPWVLGFVVLAVFCGHKEKYSIFGKMLFSVPFVYGGLIVLLDMTGLVSFGNTLVITRLFAGIIAVGITVQSVIRIVETKFSVSNRAAMISVANITIALAGLVDVLRCSFMRADDYSKVFRVAALIYMIIIGADALITYAEEQNLIEGAGVMRQIAMHDGLTGVFNRMAFNDRVDILPKHSKVGFIHFDVNNLKHANDTYGHSEGDALIKMAAHGIEKSFGVMGECYRYGGDEFTVITENYDTGKIKECMGNLRIYMALVNHDGDMLRTRLSMACGYAHFSEGEDESLADTFERADKRMYDNKRGMKELAARLGGSL